jgi:hypothetical protein
MELGSGKAVRVERHETLLEAQTNNKGSLDH